MSKNIQFQGKESFHRMNFLYQACHLLSKTPEALDVATSLGSVMVAVSKKSVLRMEPGVKRTLCKGCHALLVPGATARVRLRKKPRATLVWTCLRCSTSKKFLAKRNHSLWAEQPQAVLQVMTCVSAGSKELREGVKCVTTELDNLVFETQTGAPRQTSSTCVGLV